MELTRIDTIVQFTPGTTSAWNNVNLPVPAGAVVIDTVNKIIKEGDGTTMFASLPVCLDYNFNSASSGAVSLEGDNVGMLAICDDGLYSPSTIKLADILSGITTKNTKSAAQQDRINSLTLDNVVAEISEGAIDGTLIVCDNGKYAASNRTLAQLISDLVATANAINSTMHIDDLEWYSDSELKNRVVTPNEVTEQSTFWCKVTGFHDTAELRTVDFGLATTTPNITITTADDEETCAIIAAVYGGASAESFYGVGVLSTGEIICAGYTDSEGAGNHEALIVKFDNNLNILAKKRYGGTGDDIFYNMTIDKNDNVICVGNTGSGLGSMNCFIVKFNSALFLSYSKNFGSTGDDAFLGVVCDSANNIYAVGYTTESTTNNDGVIVKFAPDLTVLVKKIYQGANAERFGDVSVDSLDNIIVVGYTNSEGAGNSSALIVKYNSDLTLLFRKYYGGAVDESFGGVAVDANNNIYCVGTTTSEGVNSTSIIVKFDASLNVLVKKYYDSTIAGDMTQRCKIDSKGNVIVVGYTNSEGLGSSEAMIIKLDSGLNIIAQKRLGGTAGDSFLRVAIDANDNIYCAGSTASEGLALNNAFIVKFPNNLPTGTFTGNILTGLTLSDITTLTLNTSALTATVSTLTSATSASVLADSALTLANSNLTFERDVIVAARYTEPTKLITTIYTSNDSDRFTAATTDSLGNVIAVGQTIIGGTANAIIVKFDANFVTLARKIYAGNYSEFFNSVVTDSSNNIICVGNYTTNEGGLNEAFIVKFDPTLTSILIHKTYGATGDDAFNDVTLDPSGNIIVVGYTTSEGSGLKDGLVIKFNVNLTILAKKRYGGTGNDVLVSIAMDTVGNAICVGWTSSEGTNTSGLMLKLDTNLNIVLRKIYNSTLGTTTEFASVTVTAANVIYCCGRVVMAVSNRGLICKFDSNLNITANKTYGNTIGNTEFTGLSKDSAGNVFCVGKTNAEGAGNYDALVVKFSGTLGILGRKTYGTVGMDADIDCCMSGDDIIMSGYSVINGSTDAVITKMPGSLPEGIYTNKYFTDLILSDSKLTLSDDVGVVSNSTLAMLDSALTLTNGSMVLSNASGAIVTDKTIMDAVGDVFKVEIGNILAAETSVTPVFNVVTHDGDKQVTKDISVNVTSYSLITAIYGGTGVDHFAKVMIDSVGYIYAVGATTSEGLGGNDALIVKFDSSLNILAKKRFGGSAGDNFADIVIDSVGNIIAAGGTFSEGVGTTSQSNVMIVKFDSNLNILVKKILGGSVGDGLFGVTTDSNNNIFICGVSWSDSLSNSDAIIAKFDSNLNLLIQKHYGGTGYEYYLNMICDSSNNVYVVGYENNDAAASIGNAIITKFDNSLNILANKYYGGTGNEQFKAVAIDSVGNVICVGNTTSEGSGYVDALIVKLSSDLNTVIGKKIYGGTGSEVFEDVVIDDSGNIYCVGSAPSFGTNGALFVKFDDKLNILEQKCYGGTGNDVFYGLDVDSVGNIICVGQMSSEGSGNFDALIVKLSAKIAAGTVTGTTFTNLSLGDISNLTLKDSNLVYANSILTLAAATMTLAASTTMTLADSALTARREVIVS